MRSFSFSPIRYQAIAFAVAIMALGHTSHSHAVMEPASAVLEVGRTQEIKLDDKALFQLKPGQSVKLNLGAAGQIPLVFEHATAQQNNTSFWEAHLEGDLKQRVSLKRDAQGVSGSVILQSKRYWISQVQGKTWLTRMSDVYTPSQNVADAKVFSAPLTGAALAKVQADRPSDLPAVGSYPVDLNMAKLRALPLNSEVELNLPDGRNVSLVHDNSMLSQTGNYTFIGYVRDKGTDHRVIMTTGAQGETFGVLNLPEGEVRVETRKGQTWLVDTKKAGLTYAPMAEPLIPKVAEVAAYKAQSLAQSSTTSSSTSDGHASTSLGVAAAAPGDTVVDLMVVYTPGMVNRLGGDAQARTRIDNLVAVTNQIMVDSQVPIQMRLVRAMYVNQNDNVNQGDLLNAIVSGQGAFAGVRAARDASGADLVHLLHKPTVGVGSCGIAYVSVTQGPRGNEGSGYGVTDDSCPTMVMAHELGHNFGMNHDHAQGGGNPVYPYAWGYIVPGTNLGDVMSYAGQHYYKYSNPRLGGCAGQACGQNGYADASQAMSQTRNIVAGYRAAKTGGGVTNGRYQIQAVHSGKCVDVKGWSTADGGDILQWSCHGGANQLFDVRDTGNGNYTLVNAYSGKCMDVWGASTNDGADIRQYSCHGGTNQLFDIRAAGNGEYTLVNKNSGKCVDVYWALTNDGAVIKQSTCHGGGNQRFRFYRK